MSDDQPKDLSWLQGPPDPDGIRYFLDSGDGVQFTEEQHAALEAFLATLVDEEVSGHAYAADGGEGCTNYTNCGPKSLCEAKPICNPQSCNIIRG